MPLCSLKVGRCLFVSARSLEEFFHVGEHTRQVQLLEHRILRQSRSHHLRPRIAELTVCTEKEMGKCEPDARLMFWFGATSPIVSVCVCE